MPTTAAAVPALCFENVAKCYGAAVALRDLQLVVRQGQTFGLVGMNGAGKTTLIKCLLDFAEPDSGTIEILASAIGSPAPDARLAFLPERFNPPYYLTGRDFLRYMLQLHGSALSTPTQ